MSDTPETNAQVFDAFDGQCGDEVVFANLARRFERERNKAREVLKTIASWQGGLGAKWPMEIARDFLEAAK